MSPVLTQINAEALQPLMNDEISQEEALAKAQEPLKSFMLSQVREKDIALFLDLTNTLTPDTPEELSMLVVVPRVRAQRAENRLPDGFHHLHPLSDHRHDRGLGAHVHGNDDVAPGSDQPALQAIAFRDGGWVVPGREIPGPGFPVRQDHDRQRPETSTRSLPVTPEVVIEIGQYAMRTVIFVAGPMLISGMIVGLAISIFPGSHTRSTR